MMGRSEAWPILETTDAQEWAKAWMSNFPYAVDGELEEIEHTMMIWFANAILTGRVFGREQS